MDLIDPATLTLLSRALDAAGQRHLAAAQNVANASVAGAKPVRVSFEDRLDAVRQAIAEGRPVRSAEIPAPQAAPSADATARIELDAEMAAAARNAMHYHALLRALDRQFALTALAISDGRR